MSRGYPSHRANQRGVALLLVLWACTLLAILLGGYAALARTEGLQARYQFAQTQAHYAAEAGIMRAVYGLQDPLPGRRWVGDGHVYVFHYDHATVKVSAVSESGKVDLNTATPEVLQGLFQAAGVTPTLAQKLTGHVVTWRSAPGGAGETGAERAAYVAAGRDYGPRHGPFASVEELQMVLGITPTIYQAVAPNVTVWSGATTPDAETAPEMVLAAIPGMTPQRESEVRATRLRWQLDPMLVPGNGTTHSIRSQATLADGTRAVVRATIRLQMGHPGVQPYAVLRWREGDGQ
ncbi:MAG: general secretion pathway protein GspK [Rhodanobacter sp.]|nr:MAG: general secretion pathway protein GspK [Rhodanobacter sp.]